MDEAMIAEFEKRFAEDKKQEESRDKERQYLLFRICKDYNLPLNTPEEWRRDYKLGVDFTFIREKPYVWRILSLGEYTAMVEAVQKIGGDEDDLKVKVAMAALIVPSIPDFRMAPAGQASTLSAAILRSSGFTDQVVAFPV